MNKVLLAIAIGIAIALSSGCSSVQVRSDWDPAVDFARFETFALLDRESAGINPLIMGRIRNALVEELTARGLEAVETAEEADLAIGFQVATESRRTYQTVYSGWRARGYRHGRTGWHSSTTMTATTRARDYTVGALVIAMFDAESKELVWEGSGSRRVNESGSAEQRDRRIRDAVERILRDFPPS